MKNPHRLASASLGLLPLLAAEAAAQQPDALLFVPKTSETVRAHAGLPAGLQDVGPGSIAVVVPELAGNASAALFAPGIGWQTLIGDENGDGSVNVTTTVGGIDAIF